MAYQGRFLAATSGNLYLGCYGTLSGRHAWLFLPPFAEEMNLSRAVVSRQARALAERGEPVVTLDYFGTGDSEGEFEQAGLALWQQDVNDALAWLHAEGVASISLWGVRFGGLLALSMLARAPSPVARLLLWKPVLDGKLMMNQFVRLKQINESLRGGEKVNWLQRIQAGETHEIAGYPLTSDFLNELQSLRLEQAMMINVPDTLWLETGPALPPVAANHATLWPDARLSQLAVKDTPFWQNPDSYDAPALIEATLAHTWTQPSNNEAAHV
ncbi:serine aminopeptidase domain-containing protein [Motiliproteus sediminis]|uniref:serine aminopeptidase domain-containing protein n=1 Tax=Motiliproteus sediminis TaxID=1468178 RepID=UPI001AEFE091|nr:alpha/beta hydrolase [Motiliproteus sediminis]